MQVFFERIFLETKMANENPQKNYAEILDRVKTILALSGLTALLAGAGLTAVIWNMPQDNRFFTWLLMLLFLFALILVNMIYAYRTQQQDFIISIHVARKEEGVEQGWDGAKVTLYNNETPLQEAATNEMGYLTFPVRLDRKDNLYVIVADGVTGKRSNKAALYSAGQFHMIKKIVL
jgi:hypothetical protein